MTVALAFPSKGRGQAESSAFARHREALSLIREKSLNKVGNLPRASYMALVSEVGRNGVPEPDDSAWSADEGLSTYASVVRRMAMNSREGYSSERLVTLSLKRLFQGIDPWSDFIDPKELQAFRGASRSTYGGVGMDLEKQQDGAIICLPYPDSAAARAGIKKGDRLYSVNEDPVRSSSVYVVGGKIRGPVGEPVTLTIEGKLGLKKSITVLRSLTRPRSVFRVDDAAGTTFRIETFSERTPTELRRALAERAPGQSIVIDLSSCGGGDLQAAVRTASLFLPEGRPVVTLIQQDGRVTYRTEGNPLDIHSPLVIKQDRHTASAAEAFIAALVDNGRASSTGTRTAGKGVMQEVIPLSAGGGVVLTTARLLSPNGRYWHLKGIEPSPTAISPKRRQPPSSRIEDDGNPVGFRIPERELSTEEVGPLAPQRGIPDYEFEF